MFEEARKERFFITSPVSFYTYRSFKKDPNAGVLLPGDTVTLDSQGRITKTGAGAAIEGPLYIVAYDSRNVPGGGTVSPDEPLVTVVEPAGQLIIATTNYDSAVGGANVGDKVVMKDGKWHLFDNTVDSVYHGIVVAAAATSGEIVQICWKGLLV